MNKPLRTIANVAAISALSGVLCAASVKDHPVGQCVTDLIKAGQIAPNYQDQLSPKRVPVEMTTRANLTEPADQMKFDYKFGGDAGGVLTVSIDNDVVLCLRESQSRGVKTMRSSGPIKLSRRLEPGVHIVRFHLDPTTDQQSQLDLNNLAFSLASPSSEDLLKGLRTGTPEQAARAIWHLNEQKKLPVEQDITKDLLKRLKEGGAAAGPAGYFLGRAYVREHAPSRKQEILSAMLDAADKSTDHERTANILMGVYWLATDPTDADWIAERVARFIEDAQVPLFLPLDQVRAGGTVVLGPGQARRNGPKRIAFMILERTGMRPQRVRAAIEKAEKTSDPEGQEIAGEMAHHVRIARDPEAAIASHKAGALRKSLTARCNMAVHLASLAMTKEEFEQMVMMLLADKTLFVDAACLALGYGPMIANERASASVQRFLSAEIDRKSPQAVIAAFRRDFASKSAADQATYLWILLAIRPDTFRPLIKELAADPIFAKGADSLVNGGRRPDTPIEERIGEFKETARNLKTSEKLNSLGYILHGRQSQDDIKGLAELLQDPEYQVPAFFFLKKRNWPTEAAPAVKALQRRFTAESPDQVLGEFSGRFRAEGDEDKALGYEMLLIVAPEIYKKRLESLGSGHRDATAARIALDRFGSRPQPSLGASLVDSHNKASLLLLRKATRAYYREHKQAYPRTLNDLKALDRRGQPYLESIPPIKIGGKPATSRVTAYNHDVCLLEKTPKEKRRSFGVDACLEYGGYACSKSRIDATRLNNTGNWAYINDETSPCWGWVFIDSGDLEVQGAAWNTW